MDQTSYCTLLDQEKPIDDFAESRRLLMIDFLKAAISKHTSLREDY